MNDIKFIIAKNISDLRTKNGLTQIDLAKKLNYSDKAISKWERGESSPDVAVLKRIADLFCVNLDYLVSDTHENYNAEKIYNKTKTPKYNHLIIMLLSISLVWFVAVFVFVLMALIAPAFAPRWFCFIYAVPISSIVWLVFNSIWFNKRINYLIISVLMWSCLASIHLTFLACGIRIPLIYLLGVPGQITILLWSVVKGLSIKKKKTEK